MQGYRSPSMIRREKGLNALSRCSAPTARSVSRVAAAPTFRRPTRRHIQANSHPPAALTQPTLQPYNPPPITTFSDKVNSAIQAYPLQKGIGNNPTDQQQFIRQRVNQ